MLLDLICHGLICQIANSMDEMESRDVISVTFPAVVVVVGNVLFCYTRV